MAIMLTTIWTPNNSGSTVRLSQNLTTARDAMRTDGYKADVLALIPGGGGVPGEMGLVVDYGDADAYVAALTQGVAPSLAKAQETMEYSDSKPERTSTWMEIPGLETPYEDLPKGLVQTSYIKVHSGQAEKAMETVTKSKSIMNNLGGTVRVMSAFLSNPWSMILFGVYHESAESWRKFNDSLFSSAEWNSHWSDSSRPATMELVRQSAFALLP
tara:strand:+ start:888 stop:1529 length:642 start_codon:yes stop_codon:yes gene_type:complete